MALFGLDSLGRGVASAALGAQTGAIKGEAEAYRRQQADLLNQYRLQALAAHQKQAKDPNEATRKLAGAYALQLSKTRDDLENQGFFKDHPELRQPYDDKIAYSFGVASGSLPAESYDPVHYGQVTQHAADIADNYVSPYGGIVKAPNGQAVLPGEEPYAIGSAVGPYAPSNAPPLTGDVVTPPSLLDTSKLPVTSYQTPKQATSATTAAAARQNADNNTALSASRIPLLNVQTETAKAKLPYAAEKERQAVAGARAGTELKREQTRASKVLTPVKRATAESNIQHQRAAEQQAKDNLTALNKQRQVQNSQAAQKIAIQRANIQSIRGYRQAQINKINETLANIPNTEEGQRDRAMLNFYGRILTGRENIGPLGSILGADQAPMAAYSAQQIIDKWAKAKPALTVGTRQSYSGQAKNAPGGKAPAGFTPEELDHAGKIIKSGGFDAWMATPALQNPALRAKAKAAYQHFKKQPWKGK